MKLGRAIAFLALLLVSTSYAKSEERTIVVPNMTIYPGDVVGDQQIVERAFSTIAMGKYPVMEMRDQVVGKIARRTLLPGKPIPSNGVKDPDVIVRGGSVLAVFKAGGLTITSIVSPLRAGGTGDIIEARNVDSGQIVKGEVQADGTLRVGLNR